MRGPESSQSGLMENFGDASLRQRLQWLNPPPRWSAKEGKLQVEPAAGTDFWQKTHYGFSADSGHFLGARVDGDFLLATRVRYHFVHRYDQAGLMVRLSPDCWIKASVEHETDGPDKLGAVVTNGGFSDWSSQDMPSGETQVQLRIQREKGAYRVDFALEDPSAAGEAPLTWTQMRLTYLGDDTGAAPLFCGLYACSPKGGRFRAEFDFLRLEEKRLEA